MEQDNQNPISGLITADEARAMATAPLTIDLQANLASIFESIRASAIAGKNEGYFYCLRDNTHLSLERTKDWDDFSPQVRHSVMSALESLGFHAHEMKLCPTNGNASSKYLQVSW